MEEAQHQRDEGGVFEDQHGASGLTQLDGAQAQAVLAMKAQTMATQLQPHVVHEGLGEGFEQLWLLSGAQEGVEGLQPDRAGHEMDPAVEPGELHLGAAIRVDDAVT